MLHKERSVTDSCLLCLNNAANKTNSHILPKFISRELFKEKLQPARGFVLDSGTFEEKGAKVVQDSAKEDYLICQECEAYFSIIEGNVSSEFKDWQKLVVNNNPNRKNHIKNSTDIVEFDGIIPGSLCLFVYSLFWRASVSGHPVCREYEMSSDFLEQIRLTLDNYKSSGHLEFETKLQDLNGIYFYPFYIATADSFKDGTANLIYFPPPNNGAYSIISDRYAFTLFEKADRVPEIFKPLANSAVYENRFCIFNSDFYHELFVAPVIEIWAEKVKENRK